MKIRVLTVDIIDSVCGIKIGGEHEVIRIEEGGLSGDLFYIIESDDEVGYHPLSEKQVEIID